jgi:hypothetical protein
LVQELSITELRLLWLASEGCVVWEEPSDFPEADQMLRDVADELLSWIEQEAEEPEFGDDEENVENTYDVSKKYSRH